MASVWDPVNFDPVQFRHELAAFEQLLRSKTDLEERADIQPFFKAHRHLTAYIGALYLNVAVATEICFEFDIAGNFRADVLLGSKRADQFCIVEFESGGSDAIFKLQPDRKNPEWSTSFEHAFSQIVDWLYYLEGQKQTPDFRTTFGDGEIKVAGLLVMGRRASLDEAKSRRLVWRKEKVLINSNKVICITFDELYDALKDKFEFYSAAAKVEKSSTSPGVPPP